MTHDGRRQGLIGQLAALGLEACAVRYWRKGPHGLLSLFAAVLDPFFYAAAAYVVVATVFGRDGIERFHLIALGFIAFRWTLGCVIQAVNLEALRTRYAEVTTHPFSSALITATAPPTMAFFLSLSLAFVGSVVVPGGFRSLSAIWMLPPVIVVQGVWNLVLCSLVAIAWSRGYLRSELPVISLAVLVWFFSPVMYLLGDVPAGASRLFTSLNPVSHIMVAYHHAYWYGGQFSLSVLPFALLAGCALLFALRRVKPFSTPDAVIAYAQPAANVPLTLVVLQGSVPRLSVMELGAGRHAQRHFARWKGRLRDMTGSGLTSLLLTAHGLQRKEREISLEEIGRQSGAGRLFDSDLTLYPDMILDQVAFCVALRWPFPCVVLDGLLNATSPDFVEKAWRQLEAETARGRQITVIADRLLPLPQDASGWLRVVGPTGTITEREIGASGAEIAGQNRR